MMGLTRQMAMGPRLANWPKLSSRKKRGMPMRKSMRMNGIKKAPGNRRNTKIADFLVEIMVVVGIAVTLQPRPRTAT